jgi:photosystem II stability/assembly factor-like uncharacterized protein
MKNGILLFTAFAFLFFTVKAQSEWSNQTTGTVTNLHAIHFGGLNQGCAVGEGGKILTTVNAGNNWTTQTSGITTDLNGVFFADLNTGWAVGNGGKILKTTNGGVTWVLQTTPTTQTLWDVKFADADTGWAVGLNDVILRTTNGGATWIDQTCAVLPNLMNIHMLNASSAYACGYSGSSLGRVIKTTDGGANWTAFSPGTATLNGVYFVNDTTGWAVGNTGTIIYTQNGGANWTVQSSSTSETLLKVWFINDTTGWVVGMNGTLLYTEDAGTNWEIVNVLLNVNLRSLFFFNEYRGWLCGNGGRIKYTRTSEEICLVTVDSLTQKNKIIWERIMGQQTSYYKIYKYVVGSNYLAIDSISFDSMSEYIDAGSQPEAFFNRYKISAVDSSGIESDMSPYHETMNLLVSQGALATTVILAWNEYKDESGRFIPSAYQIMRGTSPGNLSLFQTLPGINISYNDLGVTEDQYYMVSVVKPTACYPSSSAGTTEVGGPYSSSFSNMEENLVGFISELFNVYGKIEIAPNPVSSASNLTIQNFQMKNSCELKVMDITGKLVRSEDLSKSIQSSAPGLSVSFVIERGDLKPGVYFVEVEAEKVYRGKLVVQ